MLKFLCAKEGLHISKSQKKVIKQKYNQSEKGVIFYIQMYFLYTNVFFIYKCRFFYVIIIILKDQSHHHYMFLLKIHVLMKLLMIQMKIINV